MARKPNYDFERREREKAKATKAAERVKAKSDKRSEAVDRGDADSKAIPIDKLDASNDE